MRKMSGDRVSYDREKAERGRAEQRNEWARESFEAERDRRQAYIDMDRRIRSIASQESQKLLAMLAAGALIFGTFYKQGFLPGAAMAGVLFLWWRYLERQERRLPKHKIEEVDDLAEQAATHHRIANMAEAGEEWLAISGEYLEWSSTFGHPFWDDVNATVRKYARLSHDERLVDLETARARSLPYRRAMEARLKAIDADWHLPGWADIEPGERTDGQQ
jgi:hypothetical protein